MALQLQVIKTGAYPDYIVPICIHLKVDKLLHRALSSVRVCCSC